MRFFRCILALTAVLTLCCGAAMAAEKTELVVFAAASMTETLTKVKEVYEKDHPEVEIVYNFDSSGTLKTQIESGADCDVFISASPKQMNQLDITADPAVNADGLDFVLQGTRINLLENKGMIQRVTNPKDRRSNIIKLTEKSLALEKQLTASRRMAEDAILKGFSPDEKKQLESFMRRLMDNIQTFFNG